MLLHRRVESEMLKEEWRCQACSRQAECELCCVHTAVINAVYRRHKDRNQLPSRNRLTISPAPSPLTGESSGALSVQSDSHGAGPRYFAHLIQVSVAILGNKI